MGRTTKAFPVGSTRLMRAVRRDERRDAVHLTSRALVRSLNKLNHNGARRSRSAFVTTLIELRLIAILANIGLSSQPLKG
jgi:hypothetical protein